MMHVFFMSGENETMVLDATWLHDVNIQNLALVALVCRARRNHARPRIVWRVGRL